MHLSLGLKTTTDKYPIILCITFSFLLVLIYTFYQSSLGSSPYDILFIEAYNNCQQYNSNSSESRLPIDKVLSNLAFSISSTYHHNGIVYDYYSKDELGQLKAACQWEFWPLPYEGNQISIETSPFFISKLPFVDAIYVMSDPRLTERQANLKKALLQQGIPIDSIQWKMKWNQTTCNSNSSRSYVYQRLNLKDKPLNNDQQRRCALAMKHADVWYEIAERKIQLALILEDDAIFVPFFKEKFTRMIYAAIQSGILRRNGTCVKSTRRRMSNDESINQNPMIVIGTCLELHGRYFQTNVTNALPVFSTQKLYPSRCTHAYLLTSCSAQALIDQIQAQKNDFREADHTQNYLIRLSPTLQSFWMDPPLSYQGNQVVDLDNLTTFRKTTY